MDGYSFNKKVKCCFCGKDIPIEKAVVLNIQVTIDYDISQQLFCHREHLVEALDKSVVNYLDPDLLYDDDDDDEFP